MFTEQDVAGMVEREVSPEKAKEQVLGFQKGYPPVILDRPARIDDGILATDELSKRQYVESYDMVSAGKQLIKFVPASGAATRMFKDLFRWHEMLSSGKGLDEVAAVDPAAKEFFERMPDLGFYDELVTMMCREAVDAKRYYARKNLLPLVTYILDEYGLEYASLPKGLIVFHRYPDRCRTAMEEHLVEGALYAKDGAGKVRIHFTVSPSHMKAFKKKVSKVQDKFEQEYGVSFDISYSVQKPSTDTIAVDVDNKPFRDADGSLVFRPGGHGALIENLNELDADAVFIKNIDNVVPDHLKEETVVHKKLLGGLLFDVQGKIFTWLQKMDEGLLDEADYKEAVKFATRELFIDPQVFPKDASDGCERLYKMLNRPVRICGMVKNAGEPGGGPFWVRDAATGMLSLQIVESSQVDMQHAEQAKIFNGSSHFNPVDLMCGIKNFRGEKFDLAEYIDHDTAFISIKSKDGKDLKALELPGLWNGSMARWISIFVEVPIITFNPVKVVNDLLRKEHQGI